MVKYKFDKIGNSDNFTLYWYEGGLMPFRPEEMDPRLRMGNDSGGTLLIGTKGKLICGSFGDSPAGQWLQQNAARYGFVMSYPPGREGQETQEDT